ncbi:hypothetical protein HBB16_19360 [Pseudonocardia sp. MCCB 268]|nr:hypothetical protein [Pseudonocardia cytotoxica]
MFYLTLPRLRRSGCGRCSTAGGAGSSPASWWKSLSVRQPVRVHADLAGFAVPSPTFSNLGAACSIAGALVLQGIFIAAGAALLQAEHLGVPPAPA